jgi:hypothetical protein
LLVDKQYPQLAAKMEEITAGYDDASIKNMAKDIGMGLDKCLDSGKVTFLYGEKDPYRRTASDIKTKGFKCNVLIQQGYGHVQWILERPDKYAKLLING